MDIKVWCEEDSLKLLQDIFNDCGVKWDTHFMKYTLNRCGKTAQLALIDMLEDIGAIECSKSYDFEKRYFFHPEDCWLCVLKKSLGGSNG